MHDLLLFGCLVLCMVPFWLADRRRARDRDAVFARRHRYMR